MYGEHSDGGMTEIESRDVNSIEDDFPIISEAKQDLQLYELQKLVGVIPSLGEGGESQLHPEIAKDSGSDLAPSGSKPLNSDTQGSKVRRSERGTIPRRHFEIEGESFICDSLDLDEPTSYDEALASPASHEWIVVMRDEMDSMAKNQVWEFVDLLPGRKTIGNKWVLKIKCKADGLIDKYKACLVAKGYTLRKVIDYEETFSPVVRFVFIHLILAIIAHLDLELFQMDVKTAFLNGELDDEIYMDQPIGFEVKEQGCKVCYLKCSIYDLKQAPRQWYFKFHKAIILIGFEMMKKDHCVYVK